MFKGKKKKEQEQQGSTAVINPVDAPEMLPELPQQFQPLPTMQDVQQAQQQAQEQPVYQQVQPVSQPVQQQQPIQQPVTQPVQQPVQQQQTQPTAYIVQATVVEPGVFRYVVDTNYPLAIGNCVVSQ